MKKITDKIKEILTPADMAVFERAIETMVNESVQSKLSALIALKTEELKTKYDALAEQYVEKELAEKLVVEKANIVKSFDSKLALLEKKVVTKLDAYLETMISEQISDAMLEKIALNEALLPVVEGIRNVFSESSLKIGNGSTAKIEALSSEISKLKSELSESVDSRIKLESKLEQSAVLLMISEKTEGLKTSDKKKVFEMFRGKEFDEVEKGIDNYVTLIHENDMSKTRIRQEIKESKVSKKSVINEGIDTDVRKQPIKREEIQESLSIADYANRYLDD